MTMRPEEYFAPPSTEFFARYVKKEIVPPVDYTKLSMELLVGHERSRLSTVTTGEMSLILSYKEKEAYVASFADHGEILGIIQLQGAKAKGYRVASGVHIVRLFASQIQELVEHPESPYKEVYMPPVHMIEGVELAISNLTASRYESLAVELGLKYSNEEQIFVKKTK